MGIFGALQLPVGENSWQGGAEGSWLEQASMSVHGTARFAERGELERAGLVGDWAPQAPLPGLLLGWWFASEYDFAPIGYSGDLHQLIVGGPGGGKFTTALAPLLLGSELEQNTVVVVDPKGEIATEVGPFLQKPFAERPSVFVIDPWDVCGTGSTARINVLDSIRPDNPNYVDDARALADAMIIPSGAENTHWDNAARNFLTGVILYVALAPEEEGKRDLTRVRDIIALTWAMPKAYTGPERETLSGLLFKHLASELAGGAVGRAFRTLLNREDKERSGIVSSIERDTAWIDSLPMAAVLKGPSLNLNEAVLGGNKYFIVLPPDYFMTHRAWLRLMVTAFAKAMKRTKPDKRLPQVRRWRHIIIDEFATLGEMSFILNDVAIGRGFDIKYHLVVQDLAQLRREYRDGWESFINCSFQRFFAVSDLFTAEYVSRMLGAATVESVTTGVTDSKSYTYSEGASHGTSEGYSTPPGLFKLSATTSGTSDSTTSGTSESLGRSTSQSTSQVQRPLLTPDEVRRLSERDQLLFMRQMHPIRCWRPPYWVAFPSLPQFTLKEVLDTVGRAPADDAERRHFDGWREGALLMRPSALPKPAAPLEQPPPVAETRALPPISYRLPRLGWIWLFGLQIMFGPLLWVSILVLIFAPMAVGPALGITERGAFWVILVTCIFLLGLAIAAKEAVRARLREIIAAAAGWALVVLAATDLVPAEWATATYVFASMAFAAGAAARVAYEWPPFRAAVESAFALRRLLAAGLFAAGTGAFLIKTFSEHPATGEWHWWSSVVLLVAAVVAGIATVLIGGWLALSAWHLAAPPTPKPSAPGAPPSSRPVG
jgi:type IV secretion system protein VirD4